MKRFTDKMFEKNMQGKGLNDCIAYLHTLGISNYKVERNSKGRPVELLFMLDGTDFMGYCKEAAFDKRTGLCYWCR